MTSKGHMALYRMNHVKNSQKEVKTMKSIKTTILAILVLGIAGILVTNGYTEQIQLRVACDAYHDSFLKAFKEQFEPKFPDIKITLLPYPFEEIAEKQLLELSMPVGRFDLVTTVPTWFSQYVAMGLLEPLGKYINDPKLTNRQEFDPDDFLKSIMDAAISEGEIYGFSIALFPQIMFYREDLLKEYSVPVPKTLEEFMEAVKKLTLDLDGDGTIDIYGNVYNGEKGGVGAVGWNWFAYLFTFGGEIINEKGEPVINSPEAVKALEYYVELSKYAPPEAINYSWEASLEPVQEGKIAFDITDSDAWVPYVEEARFPIEAAPMPAGPDGKPHVLLGNWSQHIARNSAHKIAAWKWLQFIESKEAMKIYLKFGEIPARVSYLTDPKIQKKYPLLRIAYESMKYGRGLPKIREYAKAEDIITLAICEALGGSKTPRKALDDAQRKLEELLQ